MSEFIESEMEKLNIFFSKRMFKIADQASRKSIGRAGISMRKQTGLEIRSMYSKLKAADAKRHFKLIVKKSGGAEKHEAIIGLNHYGLPLIGFMTVGQKNKSRRQKGKSIKDRYRLKINLGSGQKLELDTSFVRKKKKENDGTRYRYQVFARDMDGGFFMQSVRSPEYLFHNKKHHMPVTKAGVMSYEKNFRHELKFRINKELGV